MSNPLIDGIGAEGTGHFLAEYTPLRFINRRNLDLETELFKHEVYNIGVTWIKVIHVRHEDKEKAIKLVKHELCEVIYGPLKRLLFELEGRLLEGDRETIMGVLKRIWKEIEI